MQECSFKHNLLIVIVLLLATFTFCFSAKASNKDEVLQARVLDLLAKSRNAMVSGNRKLSESFYQQARAVDPEIRKPNWFENRKAVAIPQEKIVTEDAFIARLRGLPYSKQKMELDKRLMLYPGNFKVRKFYYEVALASEDHIEVKRQGNILGITKNASFNIWLYVKYFLIVVIGIIIIYELVVIIKPRK